MARLVIRVNKAGVREGIRQHVARVARREHAKIMAAEPRPAGFTRIVDGVQGAPEEAISDGGNIIYQYQRLPQIVQAAMEVLFDLSPVLSGEYRNRHTIMLNGRPVANLKDYRPGDDVAITNYVPYARKIEVGKMKMRVPGTSRVYQQARRRLMGRYGNQISVEFTYRAMIDGRQADQAKTGTTRFRHHNRSATGDFEKSLKPGQHNQANLRFPVLVFHPAGTVTRAPRRRK